MKNTPSKTFERRLLETKYSYVCGVDEVGIGCLAGPVVACAVRIDNSFQYSVAKDLAGLKESNLLSYAQRDRFVAVLTKQKGLKYAIASCSPRVIDKINVYQAARTAMRQALGKLSLPAHQVMILVDGKHKLQGITHEQQAIIKGDRKIFAIACASIIAKVYRDKLMSTLAKKYPGYGFEQHKGYGTKHHQKQLMVLGPSAVHRRSFRLEY
jgi:ribonuclease HII